MFLKWHLTILPWLALNSLSSNYPNSLSLPNRHTPPWLVFSSAKFRYIISVLPAGAWDDK
jgi:hypothetical protein